MITPYEFRDFFVTLLGMGGLIFVIMVIADRCTS